MRTLSRNWDVDQRQVLQADCDWDGTTNSPDAWSLSLDLLRISFDHTSKMAGGP